MAQWKVGRGEGHVNREGEGRDAREPHKCARRARAWRQIAPDSTLMGLRYFMRGASALLSVCHAHALRPHSLLAQVYTAAARVDELGAAVAASHARGALLFLGCEELARAVVNCARVVSL